MAAEMLKSRRATTFLFLTLVAALTLGPTSAEAACILPQGDAAPENQDHSADPDQAANALFVQALQTITEAELVDNASDRLLQLEQAQADLDRIVRTYPGSQLAVQLITNQRIGSFDPVELSATIADLTAEVAEGVGGADFPEIVEDTDDVPCPDNHVACRFLANALVTACEIPVARLRAEALALVSAAHSAADLPRHAERSLAHAVVAAAELDLGDWQSAQPLTAVAAAQAARGHSEDARRTFAAAIEAIGGAVTHNFRGLALQRIAVAQAEAQLYADALATAYEASSITCQDGAEAFVAIGISQLHAGLLGDARDSFAQATASPCDRSMFPMQSFVDVSIALAEAGFEEGARRILANAATEAGEMDNLFGDRANALADIAIAQADAGFADDARRAIDGAIDALFLFSGRVQYAYTLRDIALAQAKIGEFADARATLADASKHVPIEHTLARIAVEQAAAGLEDEARQTFADALDLVRERPPGSPVHLSLSRIAAEQAAAGFLNDARRTFAEAITGSEGASPVETLSYDLAEIARTQAEAGLPDDALVTVSSMSQAGRSDEQSEVLADIGFAFAVVHDSEGAWQAFADARAAANSVPARGGLGLEHFSENLLTIVAAETRAGMAAIESE